MIPAARSHLDRYFGYSSPKRVIESLSHSSYSSYGQGAVTYPLSRAGEPIVTLLHAVRRRLPIPVIALATGAAPRPTWTSLPARRCSRCLRARHNFYSDYLGGNNGCAASGAAYDWRAECQEPPVRAVISLPHQIHLTPTKSTKVSKGAGVSYD
jgi:hypothetical protein